MSNTADFSRLADYHLHLFFSDGMSLVGWRNAGLLHREMALYSELSNYFAAVTFVTYGDNEDVAIAEAFPNIRIICNRWKLSKPRYVSLLPWLCRFGRRGAVVCRSNQAYGADVALYVGKKLGAPFIARCGYPHMSFAERIHGADSEQARQAKQITEDVFTQADGCFVATRAIGDELSAVAGIAPAKIAIVPNYVDVSKMHVETKSASNEKLSLITVGRLTEQKNHEPLFEALQGLDVQLTLIGDGPLHDRLSARSRELGVDVDFAGVVEHGELAHHFSKADAFVFPSLFEGHPKALIEAMAAGLPVLAARSPGIDGLIVDGVNGVLFEPDVDGIRTAIRRFEVDSGNVRNMVSAALDTVRSTFALDVVLQCELTAYLDVIDAEARVR